jgi:hypothetical protein
MTLIDRLCGVVAALAVILLFSISAEAGAHVSFPGIGHLRTADSGYDFVPVNYSALP